MITAASLQTPLDAFSAVVSRQPDTTAFVQPLGGGRLREYRWREVEEEALRMASHLRAHVPGTGHHVAILSKNCAEWIIADLAIWLSGNVSIPLYPTLKAASIRQILDHSESTTIFVGKLDAWDNARDGVPASLHRIAFDLAPEEARAAMDNWGDIVRAESRLGQPARPEDDALATIVYTSGTTGNPKGVMHTFGGLSAVGSRLIDTYDLVPEDRMISYLPLSHVAERTAVELSVLYTGHRIFFAESLDTFAEDLRRARPTLFFAVPRIWNKFYQKVCEAMPPRRLDTLLRVPVLAALLRRKILHSMGLHQCRVALSAAAPLSPDLIHWFNRLGLEILEVYGMTENIAWSHLTRRGDQRPGWVGTPADGVECRIGDDSEILVKSVGNMAGYYKEPELTEETFADDGWLKTGDVGEIDDTEHLRITGRLKEIFKTEKGKYVAPAPIENKLVTYAGIEQACVMGTGLPQPIALVSLSEDQQALMRGSGQSRLHQQLQELHQRINDSLEAHEQLQTLVVVDDIWSVENDLVTPTLKIRRNKVEDYYAGSLPEWSRQKGVVFASRHIS